MSYSPGPFVSLTLTEHDLKHVCIKFFFLKKLHFIITFFFKGFSYLRTVFVSLFLFLSDFTIKSRFIRGLAVSVFAKNSVIVLWILKTQPISQTVQYHRKGRRSGAWNLPRVDTRCDMGIGIHCNIYCISCHSIKKSRLKLNPSLCHEGAFGLCLSPISVLLSGWKS